MSIQKIIMRNRWLTNKFMSALPASVHDEKGKKYALKVAKKAASQTKAYPKFIKEHGIEPDSIKSFDDFQRLPVTDKKNYLDYEKFPLRELCLDGLVAKAYTIEKSSGYSGKSYYWLRLPEEDEMFPKYLEYAFTQFYKIDKKSTLVLVTLALGTWTSGEKMSQALREVAATGRYPLTVMSPGTNIEEILEIVRNLSGSYEQTVIVGYPPLIKTVVEDGIKQGINWQGCHVKIGLGGEGYSEEWREYIAEKIGVDSNRDLLAISGGYGAADVGMTVGREYPLTVLIRKLCMKDKELAKQLFYYGGAKGNTLPSLLQYNPGGCFIEEINGELVFTTLSGIPLVRYNIHDRGGVTPFSDVMKTLYDFGYDPFELLREKGYGREQVWNLPFFYCFGRSDGTVFVGGANVYTENIETILSRAGDSNILGYKISSTADECFNNRLLVLLEHKRESLSESMMADLVNKYRRVLVEGLKRENQEFCNVCRTTPQLAVPVITIYPYGSGPFAADKGKIKRKYTA